MSRPGAPGSANLDLRRALHAAGRRRFGLTAPYTLYGYRVTEAQPNMPWGRSTHARGYLSHAVSMIVIGWRRGRPVGSLVRWRCGGTTACFDLEPEPSGVVCPLCTIDRTTTRRP